MRISNQNPGKNYGTKAHQQLVATVKLLKASYRKNDPRLVMAIENARRIFLNGKRAVKELHSTNRMDHWIGHAIASKPSKLRGYCKHKVRGAK